ncbi:MAG: hypothetical protein Q4D80_06230 [Pseudomonadota bacterium]|nr:hypothetical protein [Pseudomonadota bacterium]
MKALKENGFLKKIYLGLSYPFRHPVVSLVVLLAFFRHELTAVWYDFRQDTPAEQQVAVLKKQTTDTLEAKLSEVRSSLGKIVPAIKKEKKEQDKQSSEKAAKKTKDKVQFANWNVGKFDKAKYVPAETPAAAAPKELSFAEVKQQAEEQKNLAAAQNNRIKAAEPAVPQDEADAFHPEYYYVKNTSLNLNYLDKPEHISGEAEIVGANSMFVNGRFVFLYGIYTDSRIYDVAAAEKYLEEITTGKTISCYIVATSQLNNKATALCFADGAFINKMMTEHELAQNVALQ